MNNFTFQCKNNCDDCHGGDSMPERTGRYTVSLTSPPGVMGYAAVVGKKEGEGPIGDCFDYIYEDSSAGEKTWEKAESVMHRDAVTRAVAKAGISPESVDVLLAGDLLAQCMGTSFGMRELGIPHIGVYGACSTMALSLGMASVLVDSGAVNIAVASSSSHFCSAEKQFRMPLEYGGQRPPTAQWTATAAGAAVIGRAPSPVRAEKVIFGKICDMGIKDANNMGAAMAPAACETVAAFLQDTGTVPGDYDMILTGDLGSVGSQLLEELLLKNHGIDISSVHQDCGMMLFDPAKQKEINSGGSGCGCSAAVVCSDILRRMENNELKKVFFVGTGALLSGISPLQSETIPGIAHGVLFGRE